MPERERLERWWGGLDEFTRHRVLRLTPTDLLPADLAIALRECGIRVTQLSPGDDTGRVAGADGDGGAWAQPEVLLELLARLGEGRGG